MKREIQIGDIVRVINQGRTYDLYRSMVKILEVKNWEIYGLPNKEDLYEVMNISKHRGIVYIENMRNKRGYLIGKRGLKFFTRRIEFIKEEEMML